MYFRNFTSALTPIGERTLRVIFSDESVDEEGWVVMQSGISIKKFVRNPISLLWHDPSKPSGVVSDIRLSALGSTAVITLAGPGVSPDVDSAWALVQAGILKSVSWGFDVLDAEPMDPARPRGPLRVKRAEMREISLVSIPANGNAGVLSASSAKAAQFDNADAARVARLAKVADVERTGRRQRAQELERIGREQESRYRAGRRSATHSRPACGQSPRCHPHRHDGTGAPHSRSAFRLARALRGRSAPCTPARPPPAWRPRSGMKIPRPKCAKPNAGKSSAPCGSRAGEVQARIRAAHRPD